MPAVDARRPIRKKSPMPKTSSGLLMFRRRPTGVEVLLAHPGGPFYVNKDAGAWSIPKGEIDPGEDLLAAAQREFAEEVGFPLRPTMSGFRLPQRRNIFRLRHSRGNWGGGVQFLDSGNPRCTSLVTNVKRDSWPRCHF